MTRSSSGRGDTPAAKDSMPDSCKLWLVITTIEPLSSESGKPERLYPTLGVVLSALGDRMDANPSNEIRVAESGDTSHTGQTCRRGDVRIGIHFEQPWTTGLVNSKIAAAISFSAHHAPRGSGDCRDLVGEILGQIGWAIRFGAQILVAARLPFRPVRYDVPHALRHLAEVDLGDGKNLLTEYPDVHFAAVDEALDENLVPALEHRLNPGVERAHAPH